MLGAAGLFGQLKQVLRKNQYLEVLAYLLQNNLPLSFLNTSGEIGLSDIDVLCQRFEAIGQEYLERAPFSLEGKTVLELGPGLSLGACYFLAHRGKCKVYAYDYGDFRNQQIEKELRQKYRAVLPHVKFLTSKAQLRQLPKIDYIVSNAVLEHVWDLPELLTILRHLSHRETVMFHTIDFRNHNKFAAQGELYFLSFPDWLWERMANRVGHPNRILFSQMKRLFTSSGFTFEVLHQDTYPDHVVAKALQTYLKGKFSQKHWNDLKIKGVKVLARRRKDSP